MPPHLQRKATNPSCVIGQHLNNQDSPFSRSEVASLSQRKQTTLHLALHVHSTAMHSRSTTHPMPQHPPLKPKKKKKKVPASMTKYPHPPPTENPDDRKKSHLRVLPMASQHTRPPPPPSQMQRHHTTPAPPLFPHRPPSYPTCVARSLPPTYSSTRPPHAPHHRIKHPPASPLRPSAPGPSTSNTSGLPATCSPCARPRSVRWRASQADSAGVPTRCDARRHMQQASPAQICRSWAISDTTCHCQNAQVSIR